jgi:uncharacterized protein
MNQKLLFRKILVSLFIVLFAAGCATYYMKTMRFQESVLRGNMNEADKLMLQSKKDSTGKNAVLYYLNYGYVKFMQKEWNRSIQLFTSADRYIEDQQKNYGYEALALMTNPMVKPYKPEDFEVVMLNYYTALNYINLGQFDDAIVECKRINIKLNKLNDKYGKNKNRYQKDAFAHLLMGLIYDSNDNYNDAFIAYRNAYEIYESDYAKYFGMSAPDQLKKDLVRTAYLTGFYDDVEEYSKKFGFKYTPNKDSKADLVFLWMNGFGPVKDEWSINFTTVNGQGGNLIFVNEELGLNFTFFTGDMSGDQRAAFSDLNFFRIAFPKYTERKPYFTSAQIISDNINYNVELAENINEIAFKTLNDRMMRELATSLLRFATKKAMEMALRKQNANAGTILGIVNAITEKADTRNWQTLPYSFSYVRIPVKPGNNTYQLRTTTPNGDSRTFDFTVNAEAGKTYFQSFHNVESLPLGMR